MIENKLQGKKESGEAATIKSLHQLLKKHDTGGFRKKGEGRKKPSPAKSGKTGLMLLMVLPWLLLSGFMFSFFWDFDGLGIRVMGMGIGLEGLLRMVCISGLIGFVTNWIAIQMLFYPREKRPLLGQGLVPAQKDRIASRLALAVEEDLINSEKIKKKLTEEGQLRRYGVSAIRYVNGLANNQAFREDLRELLQHYIRSSLNDPRIRLTIRERARKIIEESTDKSNLRKTALRLYSFLKGKSLDTILDEALDALPNQLGPALDPVDELINNLPAKLYEEQDKIEAVFLTVIERVLDNVDVYSIIEENLREYDEEKLEKMIKGATNHHLNYIKYLGAAIGMVGGLVIWNPWSIAVIALLGLLIWLGDLAAGKLVMFRSER